MAISPRLPKTTTKIIQNLLPVNLKQLLNGDNKAKIF